MAAEVNHFGFYSSEQYFSSSVVSVTSLLVTAVAFFSILSVSFAVYYITREDFLPYVEII